jgi:cell volume regulation protein A
VTSPVDLALLIGAVVLLVAVVAVRLSTRLGLPSLLVYLLIGVALGEAGFGVQFENVELARSLGFVALVLIIAEGGLTTRLSVMRPVLVPAGLLATLGVFASTAGVGLLVHLLLDLPLLLALLYGAVLSSTDAAAVFSTLRRARITPRLGALLEAESGMNDPPAVILVATLCTLVAGEQSGPLWQQGLLILFQLAVGGAVGLGVGLAGAFALRRVALPAPYASTVRPTAALQASGFLAVYVAGVVLGNAKIPHRQAVFGFADGVAWLAQIGLFVLLGLLASPARLPDAILPALIVGASALGVHLARARLPVLVGAAGRGAHRARHGAAVARRGRRGAALRRGLRAGGHLHGGAGQHDRPGRPPAEPQRAGGAHRPAGRGRAAGAYAGRPAAGLDSGQVPPRRGVHR